MVSHEFRCILADPPWPLGTSGRYKSHKWPDKIPYPTMSVEEIAAMPIAGLAGEDAHLWLWTTNQFLEDGFRVMRAWGFKYLAPIHWIKPSGMGNYFVHRSQTILFGYSGKCRFPLARFRPNLIGLDGIDPVRHSQKPESAYALIEAVSPGPRLELFARRHREGWKVWGNEVESSMVMA